MNYIVDHIPKSKTKRPGTKIVPEYITIHSTGNLKSTAQNERDWLVNPSNNRTASWHICVDEKQAVEAIPLNEIAWHAGNRQGNTKSIGIEICESGDRAKTIQNTVELAAQMLFERNWGIERLRRHFDWSGKNCPRIMSANNWQAWTGFKLSVERELKKLKEKSKVKVRIDGKLHEFDGVFVENTNYVAIRQVAEALGCKVDWDDKKKEVLIRK